MPTKKSAIVLLLCFGFSVGALFGQQNNNCITRYQLQKMQNSTLDDIRMFLNAEGWSFDDARSNQFFDYFGYNINYDMVAWEKPDYYNGGKIILYTSSGKPNIVIFQSNSNCFKVLLKSIAPSKGKTVVESDRLITNFREGAVTYEFREYKNDYTSRQYSILIYNTNALDKELQSMRDKQLAIEKAEKEAIEAANRAVEERKAKYQNTLVEADGYFAAGQYETARLKYINAQELEDNIFVRSKIDLCNEAICSSLVSAGDSLFMASQYVSALAYYNRARECTDNSSALNAKIDAVERKVLDNKIVAAQSKADRLFYDKNYDQAIDAYNAVLVLDNGNGHAQSQITKINSIKTLLAKRSTVIFDYSKTNAQDLSLFKAILAQDLNSRIYKTKDGYLNFNFTISFDTSGTNNSFPNVLSTSSQDFTAYLLEMSKNPILGAAREDGYYLASSESFPVNMRWNISKVAVKSKFKGIKLSDNSILASNAIESYLNFLPYNYGKFEFEVKSKTVNNKTYSDIQLEKFSTAGPQSALYSMILPGIGTLKVTHGEKGWGRLAFFLISAGSALGSKLYADAQYDKYNTATDQGEKDSYNDNYKTANTIALAAAGVSASLYVYDVIWVFTKGFKNLKQSKSLRQQLSKGPIPVRVQPIAF